jgi:hypothetical protein
LQNPAPFALTSESVSLPQFVSIWDALLVASSALSCATSIRKRSVHEEIELPWQGCDPRAS